MLVMGISAELLVPVLVTAVDYSAASPDAALCTALKSVKNLL